MRYRIIDVAGTFYFETNENGTVVKAPEEHQWAIGRNKHGVINRFFGRGAEISWQYKSADRADIDEWTCIFESSIPKRQVAAERDAQRLVLPDDPALAPSPAEQVKAQLRRRRVTLRVFLNLNVDAGAWMLPLIAEPAILRVRRLETEMVQVMEVVTNDVNWFLEASKQDTSIARCDVWEIG